MKLKFKPRVLWVGLYVAPRFEYSDKAEADAMLVDFYLCVIPMLPLCWQWRVPDRLFELWERLRDTHG